MNAEEIRSLAIERLAEAVHVRRTATGGPVLISGADLTLGEVVDALGDLLPILPEWVVMGTEPDGEQWIDIGGENDDQMSWTREQAEDAARWYRVEHGYPDAHVERRFVTEWRNAE